jgi:hypothetical protein
MVFILRKEHGLIHKKVIKNTYLTLIPNPNADPDPGDKFPDPKNGILFCSFLDSTR